MKHTGALLLAVMLLASPSRSATGQSSPVRLIVNGQDVSLAASPIVHNGVLMVPVPGIFEPFGSSAVWLPDERAVVISNRTRAVIRLRINDPYALVGTDQRLLPIAPVVLRDIPFIPAQAIFGLLGAWVKFDKEENALRVSSVLSGVTVQRPGGGAHPHRAVPGQAADPPRCPGPHAAGGRACRGQHDVVRPGYRGPAARPGGACPRRAADARAFACRRSRNGSPSRAGAAPHTPQRPP